MTSRDEIAFNILSVVAEIPEGRVAAYGQIAALIGRPQNARLVGSILHHASAYGDYPCHRVVSSTGRLCPGWPEQAALLRQEGVAMRDETHVDMKQCQWRP